MAAPFWTKSHLAALTGILSIVILQACVMPFHRGSTLETEESRVEASLASPSVTGKMAWVQRGLITSLANYRFEEVKSHSFKQMTSVMAAGDLIEILYQVKEEFPSAHYRIKPDDKLNVSHVFDPQFDVNVRVNSDGVIFLPLVEEVRVGGLTVNQAIHRVTDRFKKLVAKPHILIRLEEFDHEAESSKRTIKTMNVNGPFKEFLIPDDGCISVPFIPRIKVAGKTLDEAKREVERDYKKRGLHTQVTFILKKVSGRRVFVMGDVGKPGIFEYHGTLNLAQAISMAGGFREVDMEKRLDMPDPTGILIFRTKGVPKPTAYRVNLLPTLFAGTPEGSFPLQMDDVVHVPMMARPRIFVLGEVEKPGAHAIAGTATITQAVSLAGGMKDSACKTSLILLRKQPDKGPKALRINFNEIVKAGGSGDYVLTSGDVLYVPKKWIANVNVFIDQWFTKGLYALLPANSPLDFYIKVWEAANQQLVRKKLEEEILLDQRSSGTYPPP